jgi:DNA-binding XRE family transcriptional regulator
VRVSNGLRRLRRVRGFGVSALAKEVGISRQSIYAIESGRYVPNTSIALNLASVLQVSVEELFFIKAQGRARRQ